jgi:hypothetical protein
MRPRISLETIRRTLPHVYTLAIAVAFTGFAFIQSSIYGN